MKTSLFLKPALLLVACIFLINVQSCKDPLQGDIPRVLELVSNGDWQQMKGLNGGDITTFASSGSTIISGGSNGLFRSTDQGRTWSETTLKNMGITAVVSARTTFLAVTNDQNQRLFRSADGGQTWQTLTPSSSSFTPRVISLYAIDSTIFIGGTEGTIARSTDYGNSWQVSTSPKPSGITAITSFAVIGSAIFAGSDNGEVMRSTDGGRAWSLQPAPGAFNMKLAASGNRLFATSKQVLFRSDDSGASWSIIQQVNTYSITASGSTVIAGTDSGIIRSADGGTTWSSIQIQGIFGTFGFGTMLFNNNGTMFIGSLGMGILRSDDSGATWAVSNTGLSNASIQTLAVSGSNLFAVIWRGGIYRSQDNGTTWLPAYGDLTNFGVEAFSAIGNALFVGISGSPGIYRSTDNAASWQPIMNMDIPSAIGGIGQTIITAHNTPAFKRSDDGGTTWRSISSNIPAQGQLINDVKMVGSKIFLASPTLGVLRSLEPV